MEDRGKTKWGNFRRAVCRVSLGFASLFVLVGVASLAQSPPIATTGMATNVTATSATVNSIVNPNGLATSAHLEWGLSQAYVNRTTSVSLEAGTADIRVFAQLTGLSPDTAYYFRVVAISVAGRTTGVWGSFRTDVIPDPEPILLSGRRDTMTTAFPIIGGLTVFEMQHQATGHFAIWLLDSDGERVELLANEIGSYLGERAVGLVSGRYVLNIRADGPWTVRITQPRRPPTVSLPVRVTGTSDDVVFVDLGTGLHRISFEHGGRGHFAIWLKDRDGRKVELVVNTVGPADGSQGVRVPRSGLWVLQVLASASWVVRVER